MCVYCRNYCSVKEGGRRRSSLPDGWACTDAANSRTRCEIARGWCGIDYGRCGIAYGWCGIDYGRCGIAYGWCGIAHENPPSPSFKRKKAIVNLRIISGRTQSTPATTDRLWRFLHFIPTSIAAAPVTVTPKMKSANGSPIWGRLEPTCQAHSVSNNWPFTVGKQSAHSRKATKKLAGIASELQVLGRGGRI